MTYILYNKNSTEFNFFKYRRRLVKKYAILTVSFGRCIVEVQTENFWDYEVSTKEDVNVCVIGNK